MTREIPHEELALYQTTHGPNLLEMAQTYTDLFFFLCTTILVVNGFSSP